MMLFCKHDLKISGYQRNHLLYDRSISTCDTGREIFSQFLAGIQVCVRGAVFDDEAVAEELRAIARVLPVPDQ